MICFRKETGAKLKAIRSMAEAAHAVGNHASVYIQV
jgi:hypothetical protein